MAASKISRPPARAALVKTVIAALDDMKAVDVRVMDVRKVTDVSDCMVLASGNSDRHVRSIAERVVERARAAGFRPIGVEGQRDGEWVLVDLNDVLVHVMLPRVREFYGLEELWEAPAAAPKPRPKDKPARAAAKKSGRARAAVAAQPSGRAPTRRAAGKRASRPAGGRAAPAARGKPAAVAARGKAPAGRRAGTVKKGAPRKRS